MSRSARERRTAGGPARAGDGRARPEERRTSAILRAALSGLSLCLAAGWSAAGAQEGEGADRPPNVVVILADDLGFSDLGCYGGEIETPELDALAHGGLRFTQFYNTARCWPTRAALLTGYYAQQVRRDKLPGVESGSRGQRPAWAKLLPELLAPLGYRSYHSGKWHVDGKPLANGFDRSYWLQDQGRFFGPKVHYEDDRKLPAVENGTGYYATTAIADHAVRCLEEHAERHAARPFFAYVAFTAPHFPLHAPPEAIARCEERYRSGWEVSRARRFERVQELGLVQSACSAVERDVGPPTHFPEAFRTLGPGEVGRPVPWSELREDQREFQAAKMAIHAAMIECVDRGVGRILDQLRAMSAFEDTLILFLSDNGASAEIMVRDDGHDPAAAPGSAPTYLCLGPGWSTVANTPFRRHKTWVHEGGIATPLVAHWPRGIPDRGALRRAPGHVIDLVPTLLELAGGAEKAAGDDGDGPAPSRPGTSLVPALRGDSPAARGDLWWSHVGNRALRRGDFKLVSARADGAWELHDLRQDRCETQDLAAQHPEMVRTLAAAWSRMEAEFRDHATRDLEK